MCKQQFPASSDQTLDAGKPRREVSFSLHVYFLTLTSWAHRVSFSSSSF